MANEWQASDGQQTYSFDNDEFLRAVNKIKLELKAQGLNPDEQAFYDALGTVFGPEAKRRAQEGAQTASAKPKWNSVDDMMAALKTLKVSPAKSVDPATRKKEIEHELDIIRGRVPTPKGYKIQPAKVKSLMTELKQLNLSE